MTAREVPTAGPVAPSAAATRGDDRFAPPLPLAGIRVLDLGRFIAGPYCATVLGDLGADVVRIEPAGGGDDRFVLPVAANGDGGTFLQLSRNKRSAALDLADPRDRARLARWLAHVDVLVANLPASRLAALGLDYATLAPRYPRLVVATISAYGDVGAGADRIGFDGSAQALSGAAWASGEPGRPWRWAAPYVDYGTGLGAAVGVLAALRERDRTGRGGHVASSLLRTALACFNSMLIDAWVRDRDRTPAGTRGQQLAPCDVFATRDGHLLIQVLGLPMFTRLARLLGRPDWPTRPDYATDEDRGAHRDAISTVVADWCAARTTDEALAELAAARVPCERIASPRAVFDDPVVAEQAPFWFLPIDGTNRGAPIVRPPFDLAGHDLAPRRFAPRPGEHTDEVDRELGGAPRQGD